MRRWSSRVGEMSRLWVRTRVENIQVDVDRGGVGSEGGSDIGQLDDVAGRVGEEGLPDRRPPVVAALGLGYGHTRLGQGPDGVVVVLGGDVEGEVGEAFARSGELVGLDEVELEVAHL